MITADGTYATQSALGSKKSARSHDEKPILRKLLLDGDYFIASSLATTLTKLIIRFAEMGKGKI